MLRLNHWLRVFVVVILVAMTVSGCGEQASSDEDEMAVVATVPPPTNQDEMTVFATFPPPTRMTAVATVPPATSQTETEGGGWFTPPETVPVSSEKIIAAVITPLNTVLMYVDPNDGSTATFATFSPRDADVYLDSSGIKYTGALSLGLRRLFSPDYTLMAATSKTTDGNLTVGWVDRQGVYTDVSALRPDGEAFSSSVNDIYPSFGEDGTFYFISSEGGESGPSNLMRTITGDPSNISVVMRLSYPYFVQSDGTVDARGHLGPAYIESPSGKYGAYNVQDWIDDKSFVQTRGDNMLLRGDALPVSQKENLTPFSPGGTRLIPETDRTVWSPVVSLDGEQVAFLSMSSGGMVDIFIVPSIGGEPRKLTTDDGGITSDTVLLDWT